MSKSTNEDWKAIAKALAYQLWEARHPNQEVETVALAYSLLVNVNSQLVTQLMDWGTNIIDQQNPGGTIIELVSPKVAAKTSKKTLLANDLAKKFTTLDSRECEALAKFFLEHTQG